jgi:phosphoglycerate-specific signal transduction histidine kinase
MAASKKKIVAEFLALHDKCEEANRTGDFKEKIKSRREFCEYASKYRKILKLSDEQVNDLKASLTELEKSNAEVDRLQTRLAKARLRYYDSLLEIPPTGKKRINH